MRIAFEQCNMANPVDYGDEESDEDSQGNDEMITAETLIARQRQLEEAD